MLFPTAACRRLLLLCATPLFALGAPVAAPVPEIAPAINSLGLDLYRQQIISANDSGVLLSPYSIATALAMTYAGADGETKAEMQKVLHLPADPVACGAAFQSLAAQLAQVVSSSGREVARLRDHDGDATPIQLNVANRLFVQPGYDLRPAFVEQLRQRFGSELAELDFKHDPTRARQVINQWVAVQTHDKIRDLLPAGQPTTDTRLALVNALYLRAAWQAEFSSYLTKPEPFHLTGKMPALVPTMLAQRHYGYAKRDGYAVVTLPYLGRGLQFVLLVPDKEDGLADLENSLTSEALTDCTRLKSREVILHLPKFKLEPATMPLAPALQALGLHTAFDQPRGSANFNRMAPRQPDEYLYLGPVFHKTWLVLDEHGTEAAAATAILLPLSFGMVVPVPPPIEVTANRPFLFAIQHVASGACLFLGRVTDPR